MAKSSNLINVPSQIRSYPLEKLPEINKRTGMFIWNSRVLTKGTQINSASICSDRLKILNGLKGITGKPVTKKENPCNQNVFFLL